MNSVLTRAETKRFQWELYPYGPVSLWDMLQVYAEELVRTGAILGEIQHIVKHGIAGPISEGDRDQMMLHLDAFLAALGPMNLATTAGIIREYRKTFAASPRPDYATAAACASAVEIALRAELGGRLFIQVPPERANMLLHPLRGWAGIAKAFPDCGQDVGQAGVCLALERPMPCVFHLMRVAEHGIRALGISLSGAWVVEDMTWGQILGPAEAELEKKPRDRAPAWAQDEAFFRDVVLDLRSLQKAVRDPTLHVRKEYTVEAAAAVYDATRSFMVHVAEKLHYP